VVWRQPKREERHLAVLWGVVAVCALLLRPFWLAAAPLMPACPFRLLTGVPCPTCGTTRAAQALLHGRILDSLAANPLMALAGVVFVLGGLTAPLWIAAGGAVPDGPVRLPGWARVAIVAVIAANWAWLVFSG
jgi:hypothetical protein